MLSNTLTIHFRYINSNHWITEEITGLTLEVLCIDAEWIASGNITPNPYGEFNYLSLDGIGVDQNRAVENFLSNSGLPFALAITHDPKLSFKDCYSQIKLYWGENPTPYVLGATPSKKIAPIALTFRRESELVWTAYYYTKCKFSVEKQLKGWSATAKALSLNRVHLQHTVFSAETVDRNSSVELLLSYPGIPYLLELTDDRLSRLRRFTQVINIEWNDQTDEEPVNNEVLSVSSTRCPLRIPQCEEGIFLEPCQTCNKYAAWGWGYTIRWDD